MTALLNPDLPLPADVRRRVSAEGSARWSRAVPGGRVLLVTRRIGTRLVTEPEGDLDRQRADKASAIIDTLDAAGLDASMRAVDLANLAGRPIWITVNNKPGRKGYEIGKVQISADGAVTTHGSDAERLAGLLGL